tara:strand:- start:836 stop:1723 length:888 start_codon:yes stop_codon:yes gene_type:complete
MGGEVSENPPGWSEAQGHGDEEPLSSQTMEIVMMDPTMELSPHQIAQTGLDSDKIFANIYGGYGDHGFLKKDFTILIKSVYDADGQGKPEIIESLGNDNIGIWCNIIKATHGYEICEDCNPDGTYYLEAMEAQEEYRVYSTIQRFGSAYPIHTRAGAVDGTTMYMDMSHPTENYPSSESSPPSVYAINRKFDLKMHPDELSGLAAKYAMLPGITKAPDNRNELAAQHIENKISSMAADIYQTMILRQYIPNVIKQNKNMSDLSLETSLGKENSPSLSIDTSSTVTIPMSDGTGGY